jgi:SHS family lactate transporter-like MFS transporter
MAIATDPSSLSVAWWREPTKDQWFAWIAAYLGWLLDAFDFTIFSFIMAPIAEDFGVSVTAVAAVLALTIWMRFTGAIASGWLADRIGRKTPLMLSILWYSICNFIAGFSPNLTFLLVARAALGIGMGAEWPVGASLAMESWPARSRGLMGSFLQGAFSLGFALASAAYGLLFDVIGWRGLLWLGILPAVLCVFIRFYVKEPAVWLENRKRQQEQKQEVRAPLLVIFKPALLRNTMTACAYAAGGLVVFYAINGLFATWLQTDFKLTAAAVATPVFLANLLRILPIWGWIADRYGRRRAILIETLIGCFVAPAYLLTNDVNWVVVGFVIQSGFFPDAGVALAPCYLTERFPTEVRTTAAAFCYHFGAVIAGFVVPVASYFAVEQHMGFAMPMLIGILAGSVAVILALLASPETKGKVFVAKPMKF